MKDSSHVLLTIFIALAVGAIGFFAGTRLAARRMLVAWGTNRPAVAGRMGYGMMGGRGSNGFVRSSGGMMGIQGKITAVNGGAVTVKLPNGTTQDLTLSSSAVVESIVKGTTADLKVGANIMVSGGGFWNNTQTVIVRP